MTQTNNYHTAPEGLSESILLIEWQPQHCTAVWVNQAQNRVLQLQQIRLAKDPSSAIESIQEWYQQLPPEWSLVRQVVIIHNHPGFTLLPAHAHSNTLGEKVLELTNGYAPRETLQNDVVNGWQVANYYRLPTDWLNKINKNWNSASVFHFSSLFLETTNKETADENGLIRVCFSQQSFMVAVCRSNQLLLLQTYEYESPEDISYYLLSICEQFALDQEQVKLSLSGMIDQQSALYSELEKYFVNREFENAGAWTWADGLLSELPDHYFSPLFQMAACV